MTAKAPIPSRCDAREIGAMNVYSMVPSHRSQATVSVTISKIRPRYDQITAPIRSTMVVRFTSRWPPPASMPFAMNTIVSVFATVYKTRPAPTRRIAGSGTCCARRCRRSRSAHAAARLPVPGGSCRYPPSALLVLVLERAAGRVQERLLERVGVVALPDLLGALQAQQLALVQDADPVGQRLGLSHVVRAQEDRGVVALAHLTDEVLHLQLAARVEAGGGLVQEQQHGRGQKRPRQGDLLLHPARQVLHRLVSALGREPDQRQDLGDAGARLARPHAVEAGRVAEVLHRGHALEEGRLHRDTVDQALDAARLVEHVDAEHVRAAAVVDQKRRQQAHERRLAGPVLSEDGQALAPLHREAEPLKGGDATPAAALARAAVTADELLAQVVDLDSRNGGHGGYLSGYADGLVATPRRADEQDASGLGGGAARRMFSARPPIVARPQPCLLLRLPLVDRRY